MPRIPPLDHEQATGPVREEWDRQIAAHGRMTNMKRTLAHSHSALRALMEWYPLYDEVRAFLGDRLTHLFVHAISAETDCLICSTFFRRLLIEAGEDPDAPRFDDRDRAVLDFGLRLVRERSRVPDDLYQRVAAHVTAPQMVTLTAFGAMMIATNVFNNALEVDLDDYLMPFRKPASGASPA